MASRGEPEELIQGLNELDMISELPDPLICQILYHLPTKDAVKTSVLSTRWRTLWLWVPHLDLNYGDFQDLDVLINFGDRFFNSDRVSCIDKVKLFVDKNHEGGDDPSYVTSWIDATVKRKIQHLDVQCCPQTYTYYATTNYFHRMPLSLYICETLISLKLLDVFLPDSEFISLPCLKTLHLMGMRNLNEATFERLVSSCPVLEELDIYGCLNDNVKVLRVLSKSLKKLSVHGYFSGWSEVVIDSPRLWSLSIEANLFERFTITNIDTNVELIIYPMSIFGNSDEATLYSNINRFCSFLSSISKIRHMMFYGDPFKGYLCSKWLPTILKSCPNLKSLIDLGGMEP